MQRQQWKDYVRLHNGNMKAAKKMYRSNAGPNAKKETLLQNDVSLLSSTFVSRVVIPKTITEVVHVVRRSRHVCVFGSAHSMGGHTLWPNAVRIDMRDMNGVKVSHNGTQVKVGAGITWRDLLEALDKRGLTVRCMQSYASEETETKKTNIFFFESKEERSGRHYKWANGNAKENRNLCMQPRLSRKCWKIRI